MIELLSESNRCHFEFEGVLVVNLLSPSGTRNQSDRTVVAGWSGGKSSSPVR